MLRRDQRGSAVAVHLFSWALQEVMRRSTCVGLVAVFISERVLAQQQLLTNHMKEKMIVTTKSCSGQEETQEKESKTKLSNNLKKGKIRSWMSALCLISADMLKLMPPHISQWLHYTIGYLIHSMLFQVSANLQATWQPVSTQAPLLCPVWLNKQVLMLLPTLYTPCMWKCRKAPEWSYTSIYKILQLFF